MVSGFPFGGEGGGQATEQQSRGGQEFGIAARVMMKSAMTTTVKILRKAVAPANRLNDYIKQYRQQMTQGHVYMYDKDCMEQFSISIFRFS